MNYAADSWITQHLRNRDTRRDLAVQPAAQGIERFEYGMPDCLASATSPGAVRSFQSGAEHGVAAAEDFEVPSSQTESSAAPSKRRVLVRADAGRAEFPDFQRQ